MKTVNFEKFASCKMQEKELNFLKGGGVAQGNPGEDDILVPPRR